MPTTLDLSADYLIFDNPEAVNVVLRSGSGTVAVAHAIKRELRHRERSAFGELLSSNAVVWEIPQAELGDGVEIHEGDYIEATEIVASGQWVVVRRDHATFKTRWRCFCNEKR